MTKEKLKLMPYAQAHIERSPNCVSLYSYTTKVAEIRGGILQVFGLVSATTRKHISAFVRQFNTPYAIAKKCYNEHLGYDIIVGEYVAL